jgi:hypothetical protein
MRSQNFNVGFGSLTRPVLFCWQTLNHIRFHSCDEHLVVKLNDVAFKIIVKLDFEVVVACLWVALDFCVLGDDIVELRVGQLVEFANGIDGTEHHLVEMSVHEQLCLSTETVFHDRPNLLLEVFIEVQLFTQFFDQFR